MLTLLAFMASAPSAAAWKAATCDVGRAVLRDLPAINPNHEYDTYYGGIDAEHHDLFEVCPELLHELPAGYPLATDAARARAKVAAPMPGQRLPTPLTLIARVNIPVLSLDMRTADVELGWWCTGLCGAGLVAHYVRTPSGWRREGNAQSRWVS